MRVIVSMKGLATAVLQNMIGHSCILWEHHAVSHCADAADGIFFDYPRFQPTGAWTLVLTQTFPTPADARCVSKPAVTHPFIYCRVELLVNVMSLESCQR